MLETTKTSVELSKFNDKNLDMQKDNHLIFGYANWHEYMQTTLGLKQAAFNGCASFVAVMTTFISNYIWSDANAVYFMLFLILFDAATGILKAIKNRTFSSARLPRILVIMITYTTLLAVASNVAKFSSFYSWLPGILYGGFIATLIVSIFENLHVLKIVPDNIHTAVSKKLDALQSLILGDKKKKNKK